MEYQNTKEAENIAVQRADFISRLQYCVDRLGGKMASLGRAADISPSAIADYLSGRSDPSRERVVSIARAAGVSVAWLASGEGDQLPPKNSNIVQLPGEYGTSASVNSRMAEPGRKGYSDNHPMNPVLKADLMQIPVMSAVASAGHGAVVLKEEVHEYMALSSAMVRTLKLSADETFIIYARGESMEPKIRGGEPLICSKAERHLKAGDGIYVVRLEGEILVKHVQRLPGGKVRIFSENTSYAPFEVTLNDGVDFAILGKVLHSIQQV